jgi:cellulase
MGVLILHGQTTQPITDIDSASIACNTDLTQSPAVIQIVGGQQVTAHFHRLSTGYNGPDPADPIDPTNKGPALAYL